MTTVGVIIMVCLWLIAPIMANVVGIMPKKWQAWMLGQTRAGKTANQDDVVM